MATAAFNTMFFLFLSAAQANDWTTSLTLRSAGQYAEEYAICEKIIMEQGSRAGQCKRRIEYLDARRDTSGQFSCLQELRNIRQNYNQISAEKRWQTVSTLFTSQQCAETLHTDCVIWIYREGLKTGTPQKALTTVGNYSPKTIKKQQEQELLDVKIEVLAAAGRWEEAKALEAQADLPRSQKPAEGIYQQQKEYTIARLHTLSLLGCALFSLVNIPAAIVTIRNKGLGKWSGKGLSIVLVAMFAAIAMLKDAENWSIWPCLTATFIVIQVTTAYAWYATKYGWIFSLIGVIGIVSSMWLVLSWYGAISWVY